MSGLKLKIDASRVKLNIKKMEEMILSDSAVMNGIENAQKKYVEGYVKQRLKTHIMGDPSLTESKNTNVIKDIESNIGTKVIKKKKKKYIIAGTGDVKVLDKRDPIYGLRNPKRRIKKKNTRLWRILEMGTKYLAPYPIRARRKKKDLTFYWKREGRMFVGRELQKGHPGVLGRQYFFKKNSFLVGKQIAYDSDKRVIPAVMVVIRNFVKRFSYD